MGRGVCGIPFYISVRHAACVPMQRVVDVRKVREVGTANQQMSLSLRHVSGLVGD